MADRWGTATDGYFFRFFSSEQVDQMLRDGAKRGRAGSHAAIERILKREPEVKRAELWRRIRCLKYPSRATRCRRSVILPLSKELTGMLKKLFRKDGPVFDTTNFRREWIKACVKLGLGKMTGEEWHQYGGLIPHDFRRSAVRNLIQAGVDQSTAMRITGHRTVAVFQRYNIVSTEQLHEAMAKVSENATKTQIAVGNSRNNP
jgi:integrase